MFARIRRRRRTEGPVGQAEVSSSAQAAPADTASIDLQDAPQASSGRYFCRLPFTEVAIWDDGSVYPNCCADWVQFPMGNLLEQTWDEVWNGAKAQQLRQSMIDGDLRYCDEHWCPHIQRARKGLEDSHVVAHEHLDRVDLPVGVHQGATRVPVGPTVVGMHYDSSCNLACPTCRSDIRMVRGEEADRVEQIHRVVEDRVLVDARVAFVTGTGDPFASKFFRDFLVSFSRDKYPGIERMAFATNAIMLTPRLWERMPGLHDVALSIDISVDAACAETYAVVRRPATWDKLLASLDFILTLPNLDDLCLNMTVSRLNFGEVLDFYDWAESVLVPSGIEHVRADFKQVRRWGNHTDAEWERVSLDALDPDEMAVLVAQLEELEVRQRRNEQRRHESDGSSPRVLEVVSNLGDLLHGAPSESAAAAQPVQLRLRSEAARTGGGEPPVEALTQWNQGIPPGLLVCDEDDTILSADDAARSLLPADVDFVGRDVSVLHEAFLERFGSEIESRVLEDVGVRQVRYLGADGQARAELRVVVVPGDGGRGNTVHFALRSPV